MGVVVVDNPFTRGAAKYLQMAWYLLGSGGYSHTTVTLAQENSSSHMLVQAASIKCSSTGTHRPHRTGKYRGTS